MPERPGKLRNHGKESDAVFQDLDEGADSDVAVPKNAMAMELDINRRLKYLVEIAAFACAASQEDTAERTAKQRTSVAMPDEGVPEPKPGEEKQGADWTTDETAGQTAKDADGMTQNTHSPPVNNTESKEDQTDDGAEPKDSPDPAPSPLHRNKFANTYNGNFSPFLGRNPPSRAAWFKAFSKSAYKWHKVIPDTELQVAIKMIRRAKDAFRNRYTGWRATLQHEPPVSVTVLKIEAYDLPAMDLGGTSDPYCRLKIDSDMFQTDVQTQTLNPVWATDLTFTVKSYTNLLTVSVWDWDDGRPDDLIGQAYISSADLVRHAAHELVFPIADVEGKSMGKVKLKLECTSLADHSNGALDHPMCDATEVAALTRVLWVLGVPRAMTLQAAKVATLVDVPHDVLQRFGVLKSYQMVNTCLDYWLIEVLKRWKFYADAQADRREAERSAEALVKEFQKEMDANNWDNRVKALQQKAAAQKALIDIDQHIGYIDSMATSSEDNIRLAEDFVKRSVLLVTNVEKATRLADHFRSLRPLEGVPMPGAAKETRELIAEILAKFEKEALIIDGVHAAIKDLQERVLAEQGEEGTGLRGNPSVRSGWTKKWLKHKKKMLGNDQKAKVTTPLEVILIPFVSKFSVLKDLRQAAMDTAAQFALLQDQKGRLELGEVVLSLVDAELRMIREVEEAASRRDEELGDAAERIAREQREHEERQINSCMSWLLMHDERVDPDVKERIEGLVFYFRRNLTNTTSEAVKREREIIVMQVVKLKDKEQKRLEGTAPDEENDNLPKKPRRRRGAIVGVGGGRRSSVGGGRRGSIVGGLFGGEGITGPPPRRRRSSVGPMTGIFSLGGTGKKKKKSNNAKLEEDDPFGSSSSSEQLEEGVEEGEEQRRERQRMKQVKEISKRLAKEEVSKMKKMKAVREQAKAARDKELGQKDNLFGDGIELEEELSDSSVSSLGEPIRWVPKKQAPKIHYGYYEDEVADEEPEEEEPKPKKKSVKKKAKSIANALKFGGKKAKSVDGATPEAEPEEPPVAVQREEKVAAPEVKKEEPTQVPPAALEPEKPKEPKKPAVKPEKPEKKKEEVPQPGLEKDDGGTFITGLQDVTVPAERVQEPEPNSSITVTEEEGDDGDDEAEEEDKEEGKQEEEHMEPKQPEVKPMFQAAIQRVRGKISKIAVGASVLNRLRFAIRKGVVFKDVDVDDEKEVTLTRAEVAVIESSNAFIRYKEQFQKRGRLKDFGMDDAVANRQQRAMMKHKMRQQRVMQSATSTLAFDYVCYSLAEDTLVAQKEFDVKARVVAAFKWSELCIVQSPEHGSDRITVCAGAVPNLHRLFATDMRTWLQWKQTRRRILKREMFVAYYFRIGFAEQDPAENANPDAILVRPYQRRDRSQEEGLGSGVGGRGIRAMPGRHVPIVFGADTGKARAMKQEEEEEEKDDEQDRLVQAQVERARTFLRGVLRMQACLRRLAIRKLKYFTPKGVICRELVMDMVTQAVKSSRGGDHLLHSLFGHQMDANGAFPVGSDAYTFVRSTVPMSQLTYSIGVDWDQLIATAEENELTAETARLMEEGRMRVSGAVQDSRRRTMLKCGWLAHQRGIEKGSALSNQILHSHHELPPDELRQLRIPQPPRERRTVNARRDPGPPDDPVSALVRQARPLEGRIRSAPEPPKHAPAHAAGAASIQASRGVKMRQSLHRTRARVARPPRWNEDVPTSVGLIRAPRRPRERASDSFANTVHSAAPVVWGASEDSAAAKYAMQWWDEGSESDSDYDDSDDGIGWYEQEISELGKLVVRPTNIKPQARHAAASRRDGQAAGAAGAAGADTEESAGTDEGGGGGGVGGGRSEEAGAGDGDGDGDGDGGGETGGEGEGGGGGGGHDVEVPAASQAVSDEDMDV